MSEEVGADFAVAELEQLKLATTDGRGMNLISADFDIVVVDRLNAQMHGKPVVDLLGKKCYREFVKRENICPGCPGKLALATGQPHHAELQGVRDNGTRYTISCTAYPVMGPAGEPIGFVEAEEDITEKKRSEQLGLVLAQLRNSLKTISDDNAALRAGLNAAVSLEGIDCGSALKIDPTTRSRIVVSQRGTPKGWLDSLPTSIPESGQMQLRLPQTSEVTPGDDAEPHRIIALAVPITSRGETVAKLVLGLSRSGEIPWTTRTALESIRQEIGDFIGQASFERCQRKTGHEVEAFMGALPVPVWRVDARGRITMWNRAAEDLFGWEAGEVIGSRLPVVPIEGEEELKEVFCPNRLLKNPAEYHLVCLSRRGEPIECTVSGMPFEAALTDRSAVVFTARAEPGPSGARPIVRSRRAQGAGPAVVPAAEGAVAGERQGVRSEEGAGAEAGRPPLILIADHDPDSRGALHRILDELDCRSVDCSSADEAMVHFRSAFRTQVPFALVIMELIMPTGMDGLAAALQMLAVDPAVAVVLASEWPVVGHQQHGLAGAVKKPYDKEEIRALVPGVSPTVAHPARPK